MEQSLERSAARRRMVLKGLALAPLGLAGPRLAHANEERSLSFRHTHTDERLRVVYFDRGTYVPDSLARIDRLLRDFRTGDVHPIEPRLLDTLFALGAACGGGTFEIISGFRSSRTNAMLRETGGGGVARHSLHMDGRAIDVRLVGVDTARLRDAAIALGRGGVGYYRTSDFVHLDTGRPRRWG
jgi:uncharacterized protein YcbK (DUF882 family)